MCVHIRLSHAEPQAVQAPGAVLPPSAKCSSAQAHVRPPLPAAFSASAALHKTVPTLFTAVPRPLCRYNFSIMTQVLHLGPSILSLLSKKP